MLQLLKEEDPVDLPEEEAAAVVEEGEDLEAEVVVALEACLLEECPNCEKLEGVAGVSLKLDCNSII